MDGEVIMQALIGNNALVEASIAQVDSIDAEETVISFLLRNAKDKPEDTDNIFRQLRPEDFNETPYRIAFAAMQQLTEDGVIVEMASLKIALETAGNLKDVGGVAAIRLWGGGGLFATEISADSALAMANQVLERSRRRLAIKAGQALIAIAQDYTKGLDEIIKLIEQTLLAAAMNSTATDQGQDIGDLALAALTEIQERCCAVDEGETIGTRSGLADLDKEIGGYRPGELIVIAGRPGSGKSALAMNEAMSIGKQGLPVLKFSLEMKGLELATRVLGGESRVDLTRIRDGNLSSEELSRLATASDQCQGVPVRVYAQSEVNLSYIASVSRRAKARAVDNQLGAIVIDYLQLMEYDNNNENIELGKITKASKRLAMELDCPVFLLSQLNRSLESRNDKRPNASDLRGSGSIEQDASLIIMVYRDSLYNPDTPDKNIAELIIAKQRNGRRGAVIRTVYDEKTTTFRNLIRLV
jgi:replicative DNA helicase